MNLKRIPVAVLFVTATWLSVAVPSSAAILQATGHLTLLRVHDVGTGFGPPTDFLDAEVIIRLDTKPGEAFGFQLRDDANRAVRQGMLDLLRDALNADRQVTIDYDNVAGHTNSELFRVWVTGP
jgi:hypothetical protein